MEISYEGYIDVVNNESVESLMRAIGYDMSEDEQLARDYVVSIFGHRDCKTKIKDILNHISPFIVGYKIATGSISIDVLKDRQELPAVSAAGMNCLKSGV
jgi:hypothetical protein